MTTESKVKFTDASGTRAEVTISMDVYREAQDANLTVTQLVNRKYQTKPGDASAFSQMAASAGLFMKGDNSIGVNSPSMKDVMSGMSGAMAGEITRSGGAGQNTPASRLLFPEVIMRAIESELRSSDDPFLSGVEKMIAITSNVTTPRVEQPIINVTAPGKIESMPISQLALPRNMVTITTSDQSYRIPTHSVGLEISEEALQSSTLDLVGLALGANAREQSILRVEADLIAMIAGDVDMGESAVAGGNASVYDSLINGTTKMTQKGWVKFLHSNYRKRTLDWLIMDLDTALEIEGRTGKPVIVGDNPNSPRIDTQFTIENLSLPTPRVLIVDTAIIGADTIVGLDSRYAIRKVVNVNATYSAVEDFVLRKATALRLDYGYVMKKLYGDAWTSLTIGA